MSPLNRGRVCAGRDESSTTQVHKTQTDSKRSPHTIKSSPVLDARDTVRKSPLSYRRLSTKKVHKPQHWEIKQSLKNDAV